jgi:2-oxoglutarate dehydrogenase E2 component (dihydrolipoamide succinyltransferase)
VTKVVGVFVRFRAPLHPIRSAIPVAKRQQHKSGAISVNGGDEIVEMDRMRKLIGYMVASVQTSAHVQSLSGCDYIVKWRKKIKNAFEERKLTYTIFMEAVAKL